MTEERKDLAFCAADHCVKRSIDKGILMALEIKLRDGVLDKCFSCYVMESFERLC